ncbi:CbtB domain-containing protein [Nocardioides solisilvae]|uniref:CbtB domain-containing protein n=1 Tax=Nocardioides solisilvae TaxID=1542435 RepID=UPI000D7400FF|nr:CbtB-domain containing protein [Nocardioides solisilvae]
MSHAAAAPVAGAIPTVEIPTVDLRELAPWALFVGLLGLLVIFFVSADQGAISIPAGTAIHEWVHDGRHLLGYPCH